MPRTLPQHALARRALIEEVDRSHRGWLQQGAVVLGISVLGLGVAGSVVLTSNAEGPGGQSGTAELAAPRGQAAPFVQRQPGVVVPPAFARTDQSLTPSRDRGPGASAALASLADQRSEDLTAAGHHARQPPKRKLSTPGPRR